MDDHTDCLCTGRNQRRVNTVHYLFYLSRITTHISFITVVVFELVKENIFLSNYDCKMSMKNVDVYDIPFNFHPCYSITTMRYDTCQKRH
ncbi:hypothetical protein QVD17_35863 [Tagetes erecta]|uniref:Uncharacterized protein n=1 Tax=Tagetes erecta TaxID=13708 RepID=A0AAD8NHL5_TARER|nr:hypothetical protein QVD17_35863 [Tagetes erecta]